MYTTYPIDKECVKVEISSATEKHIHTEYQVIFHLTLPTLEFEQQLTAINNAMLEVLSNYPNATIPFRRYFISDATNQAEKVKIIAQQTKGTVSIVQQPPLDGTKIALWCYMVDHTQIETQENNTQYQHNNYCDYWSGIDTLIKGDSYKQTEDLFQKYTHYLEKKGLSLEGNCLRTWLFVRDVDKNYSGVVEARNKVFNEHHLTPETHYITSTGINGIHQNTDTLVEMDAYAIKGLKREQIQYLHAKEYLNATNEYGVAFERGVAIQYGDRENLFLSGTASIDHKGDVLHIGDIEKQTQRMWLNCEKLFEEGEANLEKDAQLMIIYLRDTGDYGLVEKMYAEKFPNTPKIIVLAPVCRPTWLIEMEVIGSKIQEKNWDCF